MDVLYRIIIVTIALIIFVIFDYPRSIIIPLIKQHKKTVYKEDKFSVFLVFLCDNISWIISANLFIFGIGNLPYILFYLGIIFPIIGYWYRIKVEEKSLLLHLKKEYKGYMQKTFRLIPFLF